mmetsp:Transcript_6586/g.12127  ORF Transcript_6586/g.12127 Transcript_6586/m.12127 type:complete len:209 (+) Transcript_6586:1108-1734(+)
MEKVAMSDWLLATTGWRERQFKNKILVDFTGTTTLIEICIPVYLHIINKNNKTNVVTVENSTMMQHNVVQVQVRCSKMKIRISNDRWKEDDDKNLIIATIYRYNIRITTTCITTANIASSQVVRIVHNTCFAATVTITSYQKRRTKTAERRQTHTEQALKTSMSITTAMTCMMIAMMWASNGCFRGWRGGRNREGMLGKRGLSEGLHW